MKVLMLILTGLLLSISAQAKLSDGSVVARYGGDHQACWKACKDAGHLDAQCIDRCDGLQLSGGKKGSTDMASWDTLLNAEGRKYCDERIAPLLPDMMSSREAYANFDKVYWGCVQTYKQFISHLKTKGFVNASRETAALANLGEKSLRKQELEKTYGVSPKVSGAIADVLGLEPKVRSSQKVELTARAGSIQ